MVKQTHSSTRVNWLLVLAEGKVSSLVSVWGFSSVLLIPAGWNFCILIPCQLSVKKRANEDRADAGKHMQLWKVQPCNASLTRTIHPTDPFPFSLPHFLFLFYFPLFSHGCHIQSSTSLQVYSAQYKSSRPVLCGPEESMPLKKTEKKRTIPLSLSMVIEFLNIFSKSA